MPAPSFLAQHPAGRRLYAISEGARGVLTVLAPDGEARPLSDRDAPIGPDGDAGAGRPGALALRSSHDSGGSFPCHVVVDPGGRWLAVAHYGDGVVAAFPLARDGDVSG